MKTTFYKHLLLILALTSLASDMYAQEKVSKTIEKTFPLASTGELAIENKYGNISINGWEEKTAQIKVEIKVSKKKKEDAIELLQRIYPKINKTNDFISILSIIEEKSNSMFSRLFDKTNPFDFDKTNIQINYEIYLPQNTALNITNKFGDIIISGWNGKLKTNTQHGDMWINKDIKNANIKMKFGKLNTKSITYGNIQFKNGEIDIRKAKELKIYSSGTSISIENVSLLEIYSSKDKIDIQQLGSIKGELMFSKMNLNTVNNDINLTMEVADFWVSKIKETYSKVVIDQKSSELSINVRGLAIDFNATLEQGLLRIPKSFVNIKTDIINRQRKVRNISASYGENNPKGKFEIIGKKGIVLLQERN